MSWLFTASSIVINLTSDASDYGSPDADGDSANPNFDLKLNANYDITLSGNILTTAIRNGVTDTSEVVGAFNNDPVNGKTPTGDNLVNTIMWTPTATGTFFYVDVNNTSVNGQLIVT